jgi:glycosyltransferase involved in cell wall biosynthesis
MVQCLNYGGMERLLSEIIRRMDHERFEVHLLALRYLGRFGQNLEQYARLHVSPVLPKWSMLWPSSITRQIEEIHPDVVHIHSGLWYKGSLAARNARVPFIVYTDHGRAFPDPWQARLLDGMASRRTDAIVAVSAALGEQLGSIVSDRRRIHVIPNGVDTDRLAPREDNGVCRASLGIDPGRKIIGSVGRLEAVKGYDRMVAAFAKLSREWPGRDVPQLVLIGDGSEREALERQAQESGCAKDVHFVGWHDNIEECLPAFTIFAMTSLSEGTSISLLEAMSSGVCPVVTNVGGNAAVLGPNLAHRLADDASPETLVAMWLDALKDDVRRRADAAAARARVIDAFSLATTVRRYEALYVDWLSRGRGTAASSGQRPDQVSRGAASSSERIGSPA